jgi:hypothetical protein
MPVMALADPYRVRAELARAGRALEPSDLALRLDWRIDRVCAALHAGRPRFYRDYRWHHWRHW